MKTRIESREEMALAGMSFFGNPVHSHSGWTEENEIGRLWKRVLAYLEKPEIKDAGYRMGECSYEIHLMHEETQKTGEYEVFVGFEIVSIAGLPVELNVKVIPGGEYGVFTLEGKEIHNDAPTIDTWMKENGYGVRKEVYIQRYDERFKGLDRIEESELDMLIPIKSEGSRDEPA